MTCVREFQFDEKVYRITISPDGELLALLTEHSGVLLLQIRSGKLLFDLNKGDFYYASSITFSPAGFSSSLLAIGDTGGYVRVWDYNKYVRVTKLQTHLSEHVCSTTFSPNGRLLVVTFEVKIVQVWRTNDWNAPPTVLADAVQWPFHVTFSCDSRLLASCAGSGRLNLWTILSDNVIDATCLKNVETMPQDGNKDSPSCLAFSPVDSKLLACGDSKGRLVFARVGDNQMSIEHKLQGHTNIVWELAFSPCGKQLASAASFDTNVRLWNVTKGVCLRVLPEHGINYGITFFPNGKQLASSSNDETLRIWTLCAWSDRVHYLFGAPLKAAVFTLMCVRAQLEEEQEQMLTQQLQVPARQEQVLVPQLPLEVWLLVFEQLQLAQAQSE